MRTHSFVTGLVPFLLFVQTTDRAAAMCGNRRTDVPNTMTPGSPSAAEPEKCASLNEHPIRRWRVSETHTSVTATDVRVVDLTFHVDDTPLTLGVADMVKSPIQLVMFTAHTSEGQVVLEWATTSERNNDRFTLARSADTRNWQVIHQMNGAGGSPTILTYRHVDPTPMQGTSYYRMGWANELGAMEWSPTVVVNMTKPADLPIYPNPSTGAFTVPLKGVNRMVELLNEGGQVVHPPIRYRRDKAEVDGTGLTPGIYYVVIGNGACGAFHRVVINRPAK